MTVDNLQNYFLKRNTQALLLEGELYSISQIRDIVKQCMDNALHLSAEHRALFFFLHEWFDDKEFIQVKTSGSTGQAKTILVEKEKMLNSALMTCSFFELQQNDTSLLCMPLQYIGAKMLVVRALVARLNLHVVKPSTTPLQTIDKHFDFVPMTPQQLQCSLDDAKSVKKLNAIRHLLLGGMAVPTELEQKCAKLSCQVWSSYGMTETLSHIALRRVNENKKIESRIVRGSKVIANSLKVSPYFTPLDGINISLSDQDTLIIDAPKLSAQIIYTNDIAKINLDGSFAIFGRLDNVINSGGIKIPLEVLEEQLAKCLQVPLQVTALPDETLGERVILLLEQDYANWKDKCQGIDKYWIPKQCFVLNSLPKTNNHKPDRVRAKMLATKLAD